MQEFKGSASERQADVVSLCTPVGKAKLPSFIVFLRHGYCLPFKDQQNCPKTPAQFLVADAYKDSALSNSF